MLLCLRLLIQFEIKRISIKCLLNQISVLARTYKIILIIIRFRITLLNHAQHHIQVFLFMRVQTWKDLVRLNINFGGALVYRVPLLKIFVVLYNSCARGVQLCQLCNVSIYTRYSLHACLSSLLAKLLKDKVFLTDIFFLLYFYSEITLRFVFI